MGTYYLDTKIPRGAGRSIREHFKAKGKTKEEIDKLLERPTKRQPSALDSLAADVNIFFPPGRNLDNWRIYHPGRAHLLERYAASVLEDNKELQGLIGDIYRGGVLEISSMKMISVLKPTIFKMLTSMTNKSLLELPRSMVRTGLRMFVNVQMVAIYGFNLMANSAYLGLKDADKIREVVNDEEALIKTYEEASTNKEREEGVPQFYFYSKAGDLVHQVSGKLPLPSCKG